MQLWYFRHRSLNGKKAAPKGRGQSDREEVTPTREDMRRGAR